MEEGLWRNYGGELERMEKIDVAFGIIGVVIAILLIGSAFETAQYCSAPPITYSKYLFILIIILILLGVGLAIKTAPEEKEEEKK